RLVEAGTQAQIDLVQVEAQLHTRQEDLLTALEGVTRAENSLKLIILPDRTSSEWNRALVPADGPEVKILPLDLEGSVTSALTNRPELKQLDTQKELARDDIRYFRNQMK